MSSSRFRGPTVPKVQVRVPKVRRTDPGPADRSWTVGPR